MDYLLAIDESEGSEKATDYLIDTANADDKIYLLHVIPEPTRDFWSDDYNPVIAENKLRDEGQEIAREVSRKLRNQQLSVEWEVLMGSAGEEICELADNLDVDAIVMGRRGQGPVSELLLGSVSQYVVHHASCSVTVIPS